MSRIDAIDAGVVAHTLAAVHFVLDFITGSDDLTEPELQRFDDVLYGTQCVVDDLARRRRDLGSRILSAGLESASSDLSGWRLDHERTDTSGPSGEHKFVHYAGDSTGRGIMAGRLRAAETVLAEVHGLLAKSGE